METNVLNDFQGEANVPPLKEQNDFDVLESDTIHLADIEVNHALHQHLFEFRKYYLKNKGSVLERNHLKDMFPNADINLLWVLIKNGLFYPLHAKEKLQEKQKEQSELILKHFEQSDDKEDFVTATEITATLQALYPKMNLHPNPIGKALNKLGFKRIAKKVRGAVVYGYLCKIILPPSNDK